MKGMIRTLLEGGEKNFVEQTQVYVKDGEDECKFVCLENNMVSLVEQKIHLGPFQVLLDDMSGGNITELKLAYVGGFSFVSLMTPEQSIFVY